MITAEEARALFGYDPESGVLTAKVTRGRWIAGGRAGREDVKQNGKRYRKVSISGRTYKEHRLIWLIVYGAFPASDIDHIDGDGTNNRLRNLRLATPTVNARNRRLGRNNRTGCFGVYPVKNGRGWTAEIYLNGKKKYIGIFRTKSEAVQARKNAESANGFHVNHGSARTA